MWSPDGQEVAFVNFSGGIDVWVAPAMGGDPRQLTDAPGLEFPIQWHPAGDRLAYLATLEGGTLRSNVLHVESKTSVPMTNETRPAVGIWSPDGTMMAYVLGFTGAGATLWIADASGDNARQLTMAEHVVGVDWSPDGTQLYYVSRRTGFGDIWVVPVDGGDARQLTRDVRDDSEAVWSPDGSWLAFLSERGRQTDVWLVSVDGGPEIRVTDDTDQETFLRWRPGTTELKYEVETQREALWALSLSDGVERQLTSDTIRIGQIDLSPNGTDIAYTVIRGGGVTDLYLVSTTGGEPRPLVTWGRGVANPRWSPDGSEIVFGSGRAGSGDIWLVDATGGEPRRLTEHSRWDSDPRWSLDGSRILFLSDRDAELRNVWSVPPEGGEASPVTTEGNINYFQTVPNRPDLLLSVINERTGVLSVSRLSPDGTVQSLWDETTAFPDDDVHPSGDLVTIVVFQRDGTTATMLVSLASGDVRQLLGDLEDPDAWSPDGARLLYGFGGTPQDLAILTLADSTVQRLTDTPDFSEGSGEWSKDGETIVFVRGRTTSAIVTVDVGELIGR